MFSFSPTAGRPPLAPASLLHNQTIIVCNQLLITNKLCTKNITATSVTSCLKASNIKLFLLFTKKLFFASSRIWWYIKTISSLPSKWFEPRSLSGLSNKCVEQKLFLVKLTILTWTIILDSPLLLVKQSEKSVQTSVIVWGKALFKSAVVSDDHTKSVLSCLLGHVFALRSHCFIALFVFFGGGLVR